MGKLRLLPGAVAILVLAIVLPTVFSAPHKSSHGNTCSIPECRQRQDTKLRYENGKSYVYDFESQTVTQVVGTSEETSKLTVKGQAVISAQTPCDLVLTIKSASIQTPSGKAVDRVEALEGSSVRFGYQDGSIEELCITQNDPSWSANVKRGLVSLLQNTALKTAGESVVTESDISGRCPTQYTVSEDRYVKTRNLNACTRREGGNTISNGVPYHVPSKYNSVPGVNSTLECVQELQFGIFHSVSCQESHQLEAFSREEAGLQTVVKSSLTLASTQQGHQGAKVSQASTPASIYFDHFDTQSAQRQKAAASTSQQIINSMCPEVETGIISAKVPGLFLQLKKALRHSSVDDLKALRDSIVNGKVCERGVKKLDKLLLDAAAMSASDGSIGLVSSVYAKDQLSEETKNYFYVYSAFAPQPGAPALHAMVNLLRNNPEAEPGLVLAASGLAHQYCKMTNPACGHKEEYIELVNLIARLAAPNCVSKTKAKQEKSIAALQALGNLDELTEDAVRAVGQCLEGGERVVVHSLQAFRRNPCQADLKTHALTLYGNRKKSSEVRIQAYLAATRCLNDEDVPAIQHVIQHEKSNQVASFVSSHLRNQMETASPTKQKEKSLLRTLEASLTRDVSTDPRKYSQNYEWSTFSSDYNLGVAAEGNLIYSPRSFLPRQVDTNLSVQAFGREYNLLQMGVYLEDFEHAVEKYFGPTGKIKTSSYSDIISSGKKQLELIGDAISSRVKRSPTHESTPYLNENDVDVYQNEVEIEKNFGRSGFGDLYIRVLGTSVLVDSFSQEQWGRSVVANFFINNVNKFMEGAKDHKVDLTQPILFVDDQVILPTISGLPINLVLEGTTVLSMSLSGNIDIAKLMKNADDADIRAKIAPSQATVLKARMSTGAGPIEAGLQIEGKIHSHSAVEIKMKRDKGSFDLKVKLPEQKVEALVLSTDLYWVEQHIDALETKTPVVAKLPQKSYKNDCMASEILGLKLCADVRYPNTNGGSPYFPLSGSGVLSLALEKTESTMEGYQVKIVNRLDDENEKTLEILLNTPGSTVNRKIAALAKYTTSPKTRVQVDVDSPWNKFNAFYEREATKMVRSEKVGLKTESNSEYEALAQLTYSGDSSSGLYKYEPLLQFSSPHGIKKVLQGSLSSAEGKNLKVDIATEGGSFSPLNGQIKADIQLDGRDLGNFDYKIKSVEVDYPEWGVGKLGLSGSLKMSQSTYDPSLKFAPFSYDLNLMGKYGQDSQTLSLESAMTRNQRTTTLRNNILASNIPGANIKFDWETKQEKESEAVSHKVEFVRGLGQEQFTYKHQSRYNVESLQNFELFNEIAVMKPSYQLDLYGKLDAKRVADQAQNFDLQLRSNQDYKLNLDMQSGPDAFFDYNFKAALQYPGQSYEFVETAKKVEEDTWKYDTTLVAKPGSKFEAFTLLRLKNDKNNVENSISSTITSDTESWKTPIIVKLGVVKKAVASSAHLFVQTQGVKKVDFTTEYKQQNGAKPHAIAFKAFVDQYLTAQLNETHTRTSSQLEMEATWLPTDRQVKAETNLKLVGEQFNLFGKLKWDAGKDETKAMSINSVTTLSKNIWLIDSVNDLTFEDQTAKVIMKGKLAKELLNGEHSLDLSFDDSSKRHLAIALKNNMENTSRVKASKLNLKVEVLDNQPYVVEWENRLANLDYESGTYEVLTDMKFSYEGQKGLNVHAEVNSLFPGNKRAWNGQFEITGANFKPISYDYNAELKPGQLKTNVNARHGTKASNFEAGVKFDTSSPKKTADITYKVTLPINPKSLEGTVRYTYFFNSWRDFELTEVGQVAVNNGAPTTWNNLLRAQDNDFEALAEVADEGKPLVNFGIAGRKDKKRFVLDLQAIVKGHGGKFFTNIEGQFPHTNIRANGSYTPKNSQKNYKFNLVHRSSQGGQSYETDLQVNQSGERFALSNKLENFQKRKSLDLLWTDGHVPRKVYFLLTDNTPKYNMESFIKWGGGGNSVTTKGSLETGNDIFDAVFSIDSEALKADKWSARLSRKLTNGRHALALSVEGKNERIVNIGIDYAQKKERSGKTYDGQIKLEGQRVHFNGKFRVENGLLDKKRDGEDGRQVKAVVTLDGTDYPLKLTLLTKKTDLEKKVTISFCNDGDQDCKIADIQLQHEYHENGEDVAYTLKATTQSVSSGQKTMDGLLVKAIRQDHGREFKHTAQLIINEEKESQIGYTVYRKAGKEIGFELQLPERVVASVAKAKRSPGHDHAELSLWTDKVRKPESKLTVILSLDEVKGADSAEGMETLVSISHPALSQEMKFHTRLVYGGSENIMDLTTEIKAFKQEGELVMTTRVKRESTSHGHLYKTDIVAKSENLALNFESHSQAKRSSSGMAVETEVSYETRQHQFKKAKMNFGYSGEYVSFAIQNPDTAETFVSLATSWNNKEKYGSSGSDLRYEFLFPGMQDARIFETQISSAVPPHAHIRMFTASSPQGEFYEAFVGFKSDRQFTSGLYRQGANKERSTIGDFNLALNSSRLLFVKADWDVKNIKSALEEAQTRLEQTGGRFKEMLNTTFEELTDEAQFMITNFGKALPNLRPLAQSYKNEMKAIRQELKNNKDTQTIHQYISIAEHMMEEYGAWATNIWETVSDAVETLASRFSEFIEAVPDTLTKIRNRLPTFIQSIQEGFSDAVDAVVNGVNRAMKAAENIIERISSISSNYNLGFLNDSTKGIGKYLSQTVSYTVEKFADYFEYAKTSVSSIMENPKVKNAVTKTLMRYENFMADLIEQTKMQADTLREMILNAFPQRESQEFILAVFQYAEKKTQRVQVDDEAEQKDIYNKFVAAVQQISSEIWTVDWKNGLILAQIPLPKPVNSLADFNQLFLVDLPAWKVNYPQPDFSYGITEFYNFIKADSPVHVLYRILFTAESLIPPVTSYGMLIGSQYIKTFDNQFYHFEGNCQYLLAADFVDKNFTLAVAFEGDGPKIKKAILINYKGDSAIIRPDFNTEVKQSRNEHHSSKLVTDTSVDNYVTVRSKNGAVVVTCAKKQDVCLFAINGFYHGKSMGLLGTNNMESTDDFSGPSGHILENSEEFVSKWKLDRKCREKAIPPHPAQATREAHAQCKHAFQSNYSPLRSCFDMVKPQEYQKVCESLSSEKGFDAKKAVCTSSLAYAESCATSFINVQPPAQC